MAALLAFVAYQVVPTFRIGCRMPRSPGLPLMNEGDKQRVFETHGSYECLKEARKAAPVLTLSSFG